MASQRRDHALGKERRGASPSYPQQIDPTQRRKSVNPSNHSKHASSTQAEKRVPNYLKPTISSSLDPSATDGKKTTSSTTAASTKASLNRRKSFDKPPSLPNLTKAHSSINPSRPSSSSTLTKSPSLPKPHTEVKSLKTTRDTGKTQSLSAKASTAVKRVTRTDVVRKKLHENNARKTTRPRSTSSSITDVDDHEEMLRFAPIDITEVLPDEVLVLEANERIVEAIAEKKREEDLKPYEPEPTLHLEDNKGILDVHMEDDSGDELLVQETDNDHHKGREGGEEEEDNEDEGKDGKILDESSLEQPGVHEEGEEKEELGDRPSKITENVRGKDLEEAAEEEREEVSKEGSQAVAEEREGGDDHASGDPQSEAALARLAALTKQGGGQGKKEAQTQVYNDVIEETASKLLEKRKNKVKALVGAFETVISLQEPEA